MQILLRRGLRQRQHLVELIQQGPGGRPDGVDQGRRVLCGGLAKLIRGGQHAVDGRPQVVADGGEEGDPRPVRGHGGVARRHQLRGLVGDLVLSQRARVILRTELVAEFAADDVGGLQRSGCAGRSVRPSNSATATV